jgi:hypothetical protein
MSAFTRHARSRHSANGFKHYFFTYRITRFGPTSAP